MSETSTKVYYTVYARIPNEAHVEPYMQWLETTHMKDVLRLGQATRAELFSVENNAEGYVVEGRYEFASRALLDRYVEDHAPSLRKEAVERFPQNEYSRYISHYRAQVNPAHTLNKAARYEELTRQVESMLSEKMPFYARLSSVIALLKTELNYVSWIGFYEAIENTLWVGTYQGPLACVSIPFGKGVCGHVAKTQTTEIVEDVEKFPGHIACDSLSRSEIVLPVIMNQKLVGVLDLDSYHVAAFNQTDAEYLEKIVSMICRS